MKSRQLLKKITYRKIGIVLFIFFVVSLLPIGYCSLFDYANGDDLWEGAAAYRVLVNNGTLKEFVLAIYNWAKVDYYGWEGNWSSIILWCLEPSIWGEKVYCITPWIALFSLCGGTAYFLNHYLKKYLSADFEFRAILIIMVCFFIVQYMPNVKSGIFWYTGMINYIFPFGLSLLSFAWIDQYLVSGKKRFFLLTTVVFAYLGGAGYPPIVLAFEVLALIIIRTFFCHNGNERRRGRRLLLPLVLLMIGFVISAISPGNAVRGGENYYFSVWRIALTILQAMKEGGLGVVRWFLSVRPLFLIVPAICILTWEKIDIKKTKMNFQHPILATLLLFLISCSVYTPEIYAQDQVSGGVPDIIYFVFLFSCVFDLIYLTCYFKKWYMNRGGELLSESLLEKLRALVWIGGCLFCLAAGRYLIGNMSAYICFDYIASGQLKDFEYQMQERLEILHNPEIVDVVLPEMNDFQGPFMHMPLMSDPDNYVNQATKRFYGKESVIAIPRTEYYQLYGYPEEEE